MSEAPQPSDADDVASPPIATHPPALSAELDHVDDENDDDQLVASTATVEAGLPLKRPRGRPKGSKNKTAIQANEKAAEVQDLEDSKKRPIRQSSAIARPASSTEADAETSERAAKRPRGRPRKDGLPAGSVVPLKRPRQSTSAANITSTTSKNNQNASVPGHWYGNDADWITLAKRSPSDFLRHLLIALPWPESASLPAVEAAYIRCISSLDNPASGNQTQNISSLYSVMKTFWLPVSPTYFALTASASNQRPLPQDRFFYWDPLPLVFNGVACPVCSEPLKNQGRIRTGPLRIHDVDKPFYIIGCEYICLSKTCVAKTSAAGRPYASTDASILRALPSALRSEFPAKLVFGDTDVGSGLPVWNLEWLSAHAAGVSNAVWSMVNTAIMNGLKRDQVLAVLLSMQSKNARNDESLQRSAIPNSHHHSDAVGKQVDEHEYAAVWNAHTGIFTVSNDANRPTIPTTPQQPQQQSHLPGAMVQEIRGFLPPDPRYAPLYPPNRKPGGMHPQYFPGPTTPSSSLHGAINHHHNTLSASPRIANPAPPPQPTPLDVYVPINSQDQFRSATVPASATPIKRTRHCCKCGSESCKGKGGRSFCTNGCRDCGLLECKGRNSRRPDKRCAEAWVE